MTQTHIEKAIQDAVEKGGYEPCEFTPYSKISCGTPAQQNPVTHVWFACATGEGCGFPIWQIFLDPAFWSALGKARGATADKEYWWKIWVREFAEKVIIQGEDAESFFASL